MKFLSLLILSLSWMTHAYAHLNPLILNPLNDSLPIIETIYTSAGACNSPTGGMTIRAIGSNLRYSIDSGTTFQTNNTFNNLVSKQYLVKVCNAAGCVAKEVIVPRRSTLSVTRVYSLPADCYNRGLLCVNVLSEGEVTYRLLNETGHHLRSVVSNTGYCFEGLASGFYTVQLNNSTCTTDVLYPVGRISNTVRILRVEKQNPSCTQNGRIQVFASGSQGLSYTLWDRLSGVYRNNLTGIFENLPASAYEIYVQDRLGCSQLDTTILVNTAGLLRFDSIRVESPVCNTSTGRLDLSVQRSHPPLQYALDARPFQTDSFFNQLPAGIYKIRVKDSLGCMDSVRKTIFNINNSLIINGIDIQNTRCDLAIGQFKIHATGGFGNLQYAINNNLFQNNHTYTALLSGNYTLQVKDSTGCTASSNVSILNHFKKIIIDSLKVSPTICGGNNGAIVIFASGGTGRLQYALNNRSAQMYAGFGDLEANPYQLRVSDSAGCETFAPFSIDTSRDMPLPMIRQEGNKLIAPFAARYQWVNYRQEPIPNATAPIYQPTEHTYYSVFVSSNDGCRRQSPFFYYNISNVQIIDNQLFKLNIYPNPATEFVEIETIMPPLNLEKARIEIVDRLGRIVHHADCTTFSTKQRIDIRSLPSGIYGICLKIGPEIKDMKQVAIGF
jgi:hypothetical protein